MENIAIVGAGPAGCACAYFLSEQFDVTLFDSRSPLRTLLPTGGGRCNLAFAEFEIKDLAKCYPRGEKFLYSVFSRFSTIDTLDFFKELGIKTYTQEDSRIFPVSNSAKDVRTKILDSIKDRKIIEERVLNIQKKEKFIIDTTKNSYEFDYVILANGGHSGYDLAQNLGHTVIPPKKSLVGLVTQEYVENLAGVCVKSVLMKELGLVDDLLFTHKGISGPLAYKISSIKARDIFPYKVTFDFLQENINLQNTLNANPHKDIKTLLSDFVPKSLALHILKRCNVAPDTKCSQINAIMREDIKTNLENFTLTINSPAEEGEIVTCGGICLDEITPQTMESKIIPNLYFCGETIDVDGFCGGFNLQNCWSTAFVAAMAINNQ